MKKIPDGDPANLSRRSLFGRAAVAASAVTMMPLLQAQAPAPPRPPAPPAAPRRFGPGGGGPIKVLFITAYHPFDRENLFLTLDSLGQDITWTHVEHPAAQAFYDPKLAAQFDVLLFYDAFAGRKETRGPGGERQFSFTPPTPEIKANLKQLLQNGDKGLVFFHHALSSWIQWPEYAEIMGGAAEWDVAFKMRGKDYPQSGYRQGTEQYISVVDKAHPITQGLGDGFDIVDETYLCPIFEDSVHCLLRTDFVPTADKFAHAPGATHVGAGHAPGSTMTAWVKTAERSPIAYFQHGHDNSAWVNRNFRTLLLNSIKWAASPEARAWAHANPTRIFA